MLTLRPDRKETNKTLVIVNSIKKSKMKKYPLNITTVRSSENPISPVKYQKVLIHQNIFIHN